MKFNLTLKGLFLPIIVMIALFILTLIDIVIERWLGFDLVGIIALVAFVLILWHMGSSIWK